MPATEFVPLIQRKVIIDHSIPMASVYISDLKSIAERYSNVGDQLEAIREGPVRYSTLQRPLQSLILDFYRTVTTTIRCLEAIDANQRDHNHEFCVTMSSVPRRV